MPMYTHASHLLCSSEVFPTDSNAVVLLLVVVVEVVVVEAVEVVVVVVDVFADCKTCF